MLIDTYRSMIVRFASQVTRGFFSPPLSALLPCLFAAKENLWDQGSTVAKSEKFWRATGQSNLVQAEWKPDCLHSVVSMKAKLWKLLLCSQPFFLGNLLDTYQLLHMIVELVYNPSDIFRCKLSYSFKQTAYFPYM